MSAATSSGLDRDRRAGAGSVGAPRAVRMTTRRQWLDIRGGFATSELMPWNEPEQQSRASETVLPLRDGGYHQRRASEPDAAGLEKHHSLPPSALSRGLRVLSAFNECYVELANKDIAAITGLPKSTVSRLTYTLATLGYLHYDPTTARYRMSTFVLNIAKPVLRREGSLKTLLHPLLQDHADRQGLFVGLGTVLNGRVVYVDVCSGRGESGLGFRIGDRLPLGSSAIGRALFAAMTHGERKRCEEQIRSDQSPAAASRVINSLYRAVDEVESMGFCLVAGELSGQVLGVGVPLRLREADAVFALNCGGSKARADKSRLLSDVGPATVALANRIAANDLTLLGRRQDAETSG